ncbi:MAG: hypothetical protein PHU21_02035 [Elusimicrobia bacterium]|nr:hypothetical protein [Elusimicrobiota bacterium]
MRNRSTAGRRAGWIGLAAAALVFALWSGRRPSVPVQPGSAAPGSKLDRLCARAAAAAPDAPSQAPPAVSAEALAVKAVACEAVAAGAPQACAALADASGGTPRLGGWLDPTDRTDCLMEYWDFSLVRALSLGDARAPELCAEYFAAQGSFAPADIAPLCGLYVSAFRTGATRGLCRTLVRRLRRQADRGARRDFLRWCQAHTEGVIGEAARCAGAPEPWSAAYCRDKRALFSAARSGGAGSCGDSALCRAAISRSAAECRPLWADFSRSACRAVGD